MFKFSKLISLMMIIILVLSLSSPPVFAGNFTDGINNNISTTNPANDLKNAKLLDKKDVLKIAEYHIKTHLKDDVQTKGKVIIPSNDFINLYDLNDNLFAYLIPLTEKGKNEIGYITVGAIEDGYDVYEISIDENRANEIKAIIEDKKKELSPKSSAAEVKLVFIPTIFYIIKVNDGSEIKYYNVSEKSKDGIDVTKDVSKNQSNLEELYNNIRTPENKKQGQRVLTQSGVFNNTSGLVSAYATSEDVRLVNYTTFIPIYDNSTTYYGGDQNWYETDYKRSRGCGPTAASNITCYLARKNSNKYGKLYSPSTISKGDFTNHMQSVWNYVTPGIAGLTSVTEFATDVEKFATSRAVSLSRVTSSDSFTLDNTANYIKNGLNSDSPVAILNLQPTGYDYGWHWMTVTKYQKDGATDNRWVDVSTWGAWRSINYKTWFDSTNLWGGGLMYFN